MKFNRIYELIIQSVSTPSEAIIINQNTLEFEIKRNNSSTTNDAHFTIYNLAERTFKNLVKDRYTFINYQGSQSKIYQRKVIFRAGYSGINGKDEASMTTLFVGDLWEGKTYKAGNSPDIITELYAVDGGLAISNSLVNISLKGGTSFQEAINKITSDFDKYGVTLGGNNSDIAGSYKRGISFNGNGYTFLKKNFSKERNVFIDKSKLYLQKLNEGKQGYVPLINSSTGLLGTPTRSGDSLECQLVFEPRVDVSDIIEVSSSVATWVNGQYKITGIRHKGIISETKGGECITYLDCFIGAFELNPLIVK